MLGIISNTAYVIRYVHAYVRTMCTFVRTAAAGFLMNGTNVIQ